MDKWDLLHIGTAYVEAHTFKWNDYVTVRDFSTTTNALSKKILELEEENKKLKEEIEHIEFDIEAWKKLKAVWEKKEQKLQIEIWWLMWERDGLKMVVDKLHKELEECGCSFWFESDEVWFWKREYKRLKKWIKEHCKWYWNLFPEDEMKRQRKKADKKRKKIKADDELIYEEWLYD